MSDKKTKNESDNSEVKPHGESVLTHREKRNRKRVMRITKKLFRAIDIVYAMPQNACPYITKDNADSLVTEKDIVYDEALPDVCQLDFYRDKSGERQPAIILIHGGGFTAGDKKYRKGRSQFFAIHGFCVFCVNYGLAPAYVYPDPLKHLVTAANFIYDNAERFNIDVDRILVGGDSAGGYYAAMLAAFNCAENLSTALDCSLKFKVFGALLNCGVYDIKTALDVKYPFKIGDGIMLSLTGCKMEEFESYKYKDMCIPINLVKKGFPPTFIIYSDNDVFCAGQGNVMVDKLEHYGVYCEYFSARLAGSNHCFSLTWSGEDASAANELLLSFAKRLAADKIKL